MINEYKEKDKLLTEELGIKRLARVVGYDSFGSPIELVYDGDTNSYEWMIGGEYLKDASPLAAIQVLRQEVLCQQPQGCGR